MPEQLLDDRPEVRLAIVLPPPADWPPPSASYDPPAIDDDEREMILPEAWLG